MGPTTRQLNHVRWSVIYVLLVCLSLVVPSNRFRNWLEVDLVFPNYAEESGIE